MPSDTFVKLALRYHKASTGRDWQTGFSMSERRRLFHVYEQAWINHQRKHPDLYPDLADDDALLAYMAPLLAMEPMPALVDRTV